MKKSIGNQIKDLFEHPIGIESCVEPVSKGLYFPYIHFTFEADCYPAAFKILRSMFRRKIFLAKDVA